MIMQLVPSSYVLAVLLWLLRTLATSLVCLLVGLGGIRVLDRITVEIREFESIKGNAEATALYVGGFIIFAGLVIHGSALNPLFLGQTVAVGAYFNVLRFLVILFSVLVTLVFGWLFYLVFARWAPMGIDLDDVNRSPLAIGLFLFCFEVFMGLVIHAALSIPL